MWVHGVFKLFFFLFMSASSHFGIRAYPDQSCCPRVCSVGIWCMKTFVSKALLQIFEARPYTLALSWLWECPALTLFHELGIFSCYETRCLSSSQSSLCSEGHFGMFGALLSHMPFCVPALCSKIAAITCGDVEKTESGGQWGPWEEVGGFGLGLFS